MPTAATTAKSTKSKPKSVRKVPKTVRPKTTTASKVIVSKAAASKAAASKAAASKKVPAKAKAYQLNTLSSPHILPLTDHVRTAAPGTTMLVWAHASWCGHCVAMKDAWKELRSKAPAAGVSLAEVEHDVVSHMRDAHAGNPVAQILEGRVDGYPTILRVRWPAAGGGKAQVVAHAGERTAKALLEFARGR